MRTAAGGTQGNWNQITVLGLVGWGSNVSVRGLGPRPHLSGKLKLSHQHKVQSQSAIPPVKQILKYTCALSQDSAGKTAV